MILKFPKVALCSEKYPFIEKAGIKDAIDKETGKDRIKRMFSKTELGLVSPELGYILKSGLSITIFSGLFGAFKAMHKAKENFFRKNLASTYESQHFARRSLVDTMTLAGLAGFSRSALKYGAFGSIYILSTMTIENYRNKFSVWEHMGSAAVLGGISRLNYGFKGMLVGSGLGAVLGSIAGGLLVFNMWIAGTSFEDFRYWHHEYYYTHTLKKNVDEKNN